MSEKYMKEYEAGFNPRLVMEEASRCLLCHDAPCSKACPAGTDPAKFIRSVRFKNVKGAAETVRVNNILGAICARVCPTERYCQLGCSRSGIDKPIDIGRIQRYVTDSEEAFKMDILEAGGLPKLRMARLILKMKKARHLGSPDLKTYETDRLIVSSDTGDGPAGDPSGF